MIQVNIAMSCESKSAVVTNKLLQREDERLSAQHSKRAEKQGLQVAEETTEYFKARFNEIQRNIETKLDNMENVSTENKPSYIEELLSDVSHLQKLLTDSIHFLSQFSIKATQSTITNLNNKIQDKKSQCVPKKKFGFKTKSSKPVLDNVDHIKNKSTSGNQKDKFQLLLGNSSLDIKNLKDSEVTKHHDEIDSKDVTLSELSGCKVMLLGSASAVHIFRVSDSQIFIGPVKGSILIESCVNCTFVAACQQMRIHKTTESVFRIHVTSRAIIEECSSLKFAPLSWSYESFENDFKSSGLDRNTNNWNLVEDFNWLVSDVPSPNWSIVPEERSIV